MDPCRNAAWRPVGGPWESCVQKCSEAACGRPVVGARSTGVGIGGSVGDHPFRNARRRLLTYLLFGMLKMPRGGLWGHGLTDVYGGGVARMSKDVARM